MTITVYVREVVWSSWCINLQWYGYHSVCILHGVVITVPIEVVWLSQCMHLTVVWSSQCLLKWYGYHSVCILQWCGHHSAY